MYGATLRALPGGRQSEIRNPQSEIGDSRSAISFRVPPTAPTDRIPVLDALRGLALFGIFLMNLAVFTGFIFMPPADMASLPTAAIDRPIALVMVWLAYGKFYSLFSLLFGIGFALQLDSALRNGDTRLSRFKRRLAVLLLIAFVHLTFIWEGDILALYAMIGFLLIPCRRFSQRQLILAAAILVATPIAQQALIVASHGALDPGAPLLEAGKRWQLAMGLGADVEPYPFLTTASLREALWFQLSGFWFRYADLLSTGRPFKVLAVFLLGLWAGRSGILRDLDASTPLLMRVRRWGYIVGLPSALLQAMLLLTGTDPLSPASIVEAAAYALGMVPLALAYAAHVSLLWRRQAWRDRLSLVIPAGRMALTNYLSQTFIAIALFYGIGLGLMGKVGPTLWPVITVAVVGLQCAASWWWLARYRFGPMEWLWRAATYGRRP